MANEKSEHGFVVQAKRQWLTILVILASGFGIFVGLQKDVKTAKADIKDLKEEGDNLQQVQIRYEGKLDMLNFKVDAILKKVDCL